MVATVVGVQVGQGEEVALGAVHRRNLGSGQSTSTKLI